MSDTLITTLPEVMGGAPVFAGTRVPVQTLFERVATVSVFLTVGFSHARYPKGHRT
jgi:hypothetical protein